MHDARTEHGQNRLEAEIDNALRLAEERAEFEWLLDHPEIKRSANLVRFLLYLQQIL